MPTFQYPSKNKKKDKKEAEGHGRALLGVASPRPFYLRAYTLFNRFRLEKQGNVESVHAEIDETHVFLAHIHHGEGEHRFEALYVVGPNTQKGRKDVRRYFDSLRRDMNIVSVEKSSIQDWAIANTKTTLEHLAEKRSDKDTIYFLLKENEPKKGEHKIGFHRGAD